jgi:septal ring factor EnvC (AmiA/AmiB activator)
MEKGAGRREKGERTEKGKRARVSRRRPFSILRSLSLLLFPFSLLLVAHPAGAQQTDLEQSRRRLDEIKQERQALERQQLRMQGQVTDVGAALKNLERQRDATNRLVNVIEEQIGGLSSQLDHSAAELTLAQDNLADRKAVLQRRLADIYRRGPLYTFQVLLAAESFGDLLTRYKYLYLTSRQDRNLVDDITRLARNVQLERDKLLGVRDQLDQTKEERQAELNHYDDLATQRQTQLQQLQHSSQQTRQRLTALQQDEVSVTNLLATLERSAKAAAAERAARPATVNEPPAAGGLSTSDIGKLDWPVDGNIVINFGADSLEEGGGVVTWTGIGIKAPAGTAVKAVAAGEVKGVQRLSTYGLGVVVQHGNGYYSLYFQLQSASVKVGDKVARGTVIGTVGGQNTPKGSHLYFEIRGQNQIALDPIAWLKARR